MCQVGMLLREQSRTNALSSATSAAGVPIEGEGCAASMLIVRLSPLIHPRRTGQGYSKL
jgi:hypothetical protein